MQASPAGVAAGPVRAALELQGRRVKRESALRWMLLHSLLLAVLGYDLWSACPGRVSLLHWAEAALAAAALGALLQHATALLPPAGPARAVTARQLRLLGLKPDDLDSSFRLVDDSVCSQPARSPAAAAGAGAGAGGGAAEALTLSLSRSWSSSPPSSPTSPPSPPSPADSPLDRSRSFADTSDEFIADQTSLTEYLKQHDARARAAAAAAPPPRPAWLPPPAPPAYRRADLDHESAPRSERAAEGEAAWWRLPLAPRQLAQYNLNLRLWLHMTILTRLMRQIEAADEELARRALPDHAIGQVGVEQLRALSREVGGARALLPYLAAFRDQRHLLARLKQLASGSCLSNYKWAGAGDAAQPSDAEIILHLFATYMDGQVGSSCGGACGGAAVGGGGALPACCAPFSAAHLWTPPAAAGSPSAPGAGGTAGAAGARPALALHRVTPHPPHYVLVHGDHTIDVGRGRNNLLHSLLVFLALAAPPPSPASPPAAPSPALRRLQLGPAGINILWVIGR